MDEDQTEEAKRTQDLRAQAMSQYEQLMRLRIGDLFMSKVEADAQLSVLGARNATMQAELDGLKTKPASAE